MRITPFFVQWPEFAQTSFRIRNLTILIPFALLIWFLMSGGCAGSAVKTSPLSGSPPAHHLSIMAYNVENFFDARHDEKHEDFAFLPVKEKRRNPLVQNYCRHQPVFRRRECFNLNWTDEVVEKKLQAVANGILQVYDQGPDILLLEETESTDLVHRLSQKMPQSHYQTLVRIEADDKRGIAVSLLSRFPLAGVAQIHRLVSANPETKEKPETRGILEVPLLLPNGQTLTVFGVHLPSQFNPVSERQDAIQTLRALVSQKKPDDLWVIGGDWNISSVEEEKYAFFSRQMSEVGVVSHLVGCSSCPGTHYYKHHWEFLDILVFSKNFLEKTNPYFLVRESIQTPHSARDQILKSGAPQHFDPKTGKGISDHLPIFAEFEKTNQETR